MSKNKTFFSDQHKKRFETIETIIKNNNFNNPKIKSEINKKIKEWVRKGDVGEGYDLVLAAYSYLKDAIDYQKYEGRPKAKDARKAFDEIFFDVFESDNNFEKSICSFTLEFMGLFDISSYSYSKNMDKAKEKIAMEGRAMDLDTRLALNVKNELEDNVFNYSRYDIPLLIVGETGTSKGLLARAIHRMSKRRKAPYHYWHL